MNEEMMAAQAGQGQGRADAMQVLMENNQMLKEIGGMLQQLIGSEQQEQGASEEDSLRQEALARLAAQQGA